MAALRLLAALAALGSLQLLAALQSLAALAKIARSWNARRIGIMIFAPQACYSHPRLGVNSVTCSMPFPIGQGRLLGRLKQLGAVAVSQQPATTSHADG